MDDKFYDDEHRHKIPMNFREMSVLTDVIDEALKTADEHQTAILKSIRSRMYGYIS